MVHIIHVLWRRRKLIRILLLLRIFINTHLFLIIIVEGISVIITHSIIIIGVLILTYISAHFIYLIH